MFTTLFDSKKVKSDPHICLKPQINTIIVKVRKDLLKSLFDKLDISPAETWESFSPRSPQPLYEAIDQLPEDKANELGHVLERIAIVGGARGNIALISSALQEWQMPITEEMKQYTAPNLATWAYLNLQSGQWHALEQRAEANAKPKGAWRFYNLDIGTEIDPGAIASHRDQLVKAISNNTAKAEFRGYGCEADHYSFSGVEYLMVKFTDYPERSDSWDASENQFKPSENPTGVPLVFSFERDCCKLGVLYEGSRTRCNNLAGVFSHTVFGHFSRIEPVHYDLSLLKHESALPADENRGIKASKIVGMELWLGNKRRRRTYYECDTDIQQVLKEELPKEILSDERTVVKRVQIMITYATRRSPNTEKTFVVSEGSIGGMSDPHHGIGAIFKDYLKDVLKIVATDDEDNS